MKSRKQISTTFGISEQYLSMLLAGKRPVSWPLAAIMSERFPGKTIQQWRNATPKELEVAFKQLPESEEKGAA